MSSRLPLWEWGLPIGKQAFRRHDHDKPWHLVAQPVDILARFPAAQEDPL
jgi:hypothetical protein